MAKGVTDHKQDENMARNNREQQEATTNFARKIKAIRFQVQLSPFLDKIDSINFFLPTDNDNKERKEEKKRSNERNDPIVSGSNLTLSRANLSGVGG